ncbi:MAG: type II secretion system F family protein [Peptococcaceae bacterium]|nr:type II secretion system F family protein [Peptococcaceae bacterium]
MAIWKWKAVDEHGKKHQGIWVEKDWINVVYYLRKQQLYPFKIKRSLAVSIVNLLFSVNDKLYWANTARKFSLLLDAGIPLLAALDIIRDKETSPVRKNQWQKVSLKLQAGEDLSNSFTDFSPRPGAFFESMLKAGEKTGTLNLSFHDIAEQLEEEYFFEKKIKSVLFYPLLLLFICLLEIYVLSVFVIPMYQDLFANLNIELPFITQVLFIIGSFIPYFLLSIPVIFIIFRKFKRINLLNILGTKKILKYKDLLQFCTLLERLLNAGISLLASLQILEKIFNDRKVLRLIAQLKQAIQEGRGVAAVILTDTLFPAEIGKMLAIAEESGRLSQMLGHIANMFRKELDQELKKYSKILEPILVLVMAGLIGVVAIGVLLPIFDVSVYIK